MLGSSIKNEKVCNHLKGLNSKQIRVCRRHIELMNSVNEGATISIRECQHQFRFRKWNCTTVNKENEPVFGNALNKGRFMMEYIVVSFVALVEFVEPRRKNCVLIIVIFIHIW